MADGTPITAVFVFGLRNERFSIERKLTPACTEPSADDQPNATQDAFFTAFDASDLALWTAMREHGEWESSHGRNDSLEFSPSR